MINKIRALSLVAAACLAMGVAGAASAATVCSGGVPDVTEQVTGSGGEVFSCQFEVNVPNSSDTAYNGLFFGGGFTQVARVNNPGGTSGVLELLGGSKSGEWNIAASVLSMYESLVLVFKSASPNNTDPGEAVAYLVGDILSGDYITPFFSNVGANCRNNTTTAQICERDISHVALLGKKINGGGGGGPGQVPVPASLPLLLGALGIAGFVSRRRKRA